MLPVVRGYISDVANAIIRTVCIHTVTMQTHLSTTLRPAFVFVFASVRNRISNLARWTSALKRADRVQAGTAIA